MDPRDTSEMLGIAEEIAEEEATRNINNDPLSQNELLGLDDDMLDADLTD